MSVTTQPRTFALPDLGEGLTDAELVRWRVAEGESVAIDQVVAEVETAKALVEVPTPFDGTVLTLHAAEGDTVMVGAALITVGDPDAVPSAAGSGPADASPSVGSEQAQSYREEEKAGSGAVLIGYGTSEDTGGRRRRRRRGAAPAADSAGSATQTQAAAQAPAAAQAAPADGPAAGASARTEAAPTASGTGHRAEAPRVVNPLVRRLARDHGVDVRTLRGSGPHGLIVRADVLAALEAPTEERSAAEPGGRDAVTGLAVTARTPMTGMRRAVADAMVRSRRQIPEATVWVDVDASELLALRRGIRPDADGRRPGVLALVGRFVTAGLMRVPALNARIDTGADGREEIVEFSGVNLGIAAQTPRGLVVPAVQDAQGLSARELDAAIADLVATARDGRCTPEQLTRGTFTLNNYGVFDVDGSAAIINHPQVAILGLGRIKERPWVVDGELAVRSIMELTLSFDHRVCDGGEASRFLRFVADAIERPGEALAEL